MATFILNCLLVLNIRVILIHEMFYLSTTCYFTFLFSFVAYVINKVAWLEFR